MADSLPHGPVAGDPMARYVFGGIVVDPTARPSVPELLREDYRRMHPDDVARPGLGQSHRLKEFYQLQRAAGIR